jgi:hypothetical protein
MNGDSDMVKPRVPIIVVWASALHAMGHRASFLKGEGMFVAKPRTTNGSQ